MSAMPVRSSPCDTTEAARHIQYNINDPLYFNETVPHIKCRWATRETNFKRELFGVAAPNLLKNASSIGSDYAGEHFQHIQKGVSMSQGTVKWFNSEKGFGFIALDGGGQDAFVHISAVERAGISQLREGDKVSFELVADRKSGKMSADKLQIVT
jgi:CspA family cold shock protein